LGLIHGLTQHTDSESVGETDRTRERSAMRRIAGLLTIAALAACAAPAAAAPPGHGLITEGPFSCTGLGDTPITHSAGASAYIGDQHYVVASFEFTPTGGTGEPKQFGQKTGLSGSLTCTQQFPGQGNLTVVLLPVAPGT
jgi:hypothetical protein